MSAENKFVRWLLYAEWVCLQNNLGSWLEECEYICLPWPRGLKIKNYCDYRVYLVNSENTDMEAIWIFK